MLYLLTDGKGRWLAGNLDIVATDLWETQGPAQFSYRKRESDQSERQAFGIVARLPGDLHLLVARDIESQETLKRLLRRAFVLGYALIFIIGAAGAVIVSRRMLRRVDAASNAARSIMQGNLAERIPVTGRNDEFDRLSQNLNAMLDRIQDLMAGLKNVSDNIAHDLKTPLHRLRTRAERALQSSRSPEKLAEALGSVIEEADTLIQTFDALLSIARLEAGSRSESFGPLNICALIRDVADLYEPAAEERGLSLRLSCFGDVMMAGEKHLIGQALANLLDNAIKYALPASKGRPESIEQTDVADRTGRQGRRRGYRDFGPWPRHSQEGSRARSPALCAPSAEPVRSREAAWASALLRPWQDCTMARLRWKTTSRGCGYASGLKKNLPATRWRAAVEAHALFTHAG